MGGVPATRFRGRADPALVAFAWSRAAIWLAAIGFYLALRPDRPRAHGPTPGGDDYPLRLWANWDGAWFAQIAQHSYASGAATPAFYPLYPGLVAVAGRAIGGHYVLAGVVVALAAAAVAFVLLRRLGAIEIGDGAALRATILLAIFPLSFFLQAVYSESLYLALAVGAFYAGRRGRWPLAGLACAAGFLTRPSAVALWGGLLVLAWQARSRRALAWIAPAPCALGLYCLLLRHEVGDAFAMFHAERYWHRSLSPAGPLGGAWDGLVAAIHGVHRLVAGGGVPDGWVFPANLSPGGVAVVNVVGFAWLVVYVVLAVLVWRRYGAAYGTFAALSILVPLSAPWSTFPLFSLPRFGLVVFPFYWVLAELASTRRRYAVLASVCVVLLAVDLARWSLWWWVA